MKNTQNRVWCMFVVNDRKHSRGRHSQSHIASHWLKRAPAWYTTSCTNAGSHILHLKLNRR